VRDISSSKQPCKRKTLLNRLPIAPHILFFLFYNLVYFLPLLLVYFLGYSEGGAEEVLGMSAPAMLRIGAMYLTGFVSFVIGSQVNRLTYFAFRGRSNQNWNPYLLQLTMSEVAIIGVLFIAFLFSKISIIPLGVYHEYAFDADLMGGPLWSFSMFCSEMLLLSAVIVLFSKSKHNTRWFFFLSAINAINLLHGTRIFFTITVMIYALYAYIRGKLPLRRIFIYAPPAFLGVLTVTYLIYLFRESASLNGAFSPAKLISPLVYESIFSQFSLISIVNNPTIVSATGNIVGFFSDIVVFTTPRILNPDKADYLYTNSFSYLSPKGGFNGYAMSLIYFGVFFPLFFFILGVIGSWLHGKAEKNGWWLVLYAYFTADFLFRINRDGYVIPIKMMINVIQLVVALFISRYLSALLSTKPQQPTVAPP
jgi:hypothetical protein